MFKRICIPVADADTTRHVTQWGFEFARKLEATVIVTHVSPAKYLEIRDAPEAGIDPLEPWVKLGAQMDVRTEARWAYGPDTAETICAVARDEHAELIFMPTHAREGINRLLLGSVAERVTRLSMIPVMLVRLNTPAEALSFTRIVVPVDGSDESELALRRASELAQQLEASIQLVHVIEDLPSQYNAFDAALGESTVKEFHAALETRAKTITARAADTCDPAPSEIRIAHTNGDTVARAINRVAEELRGDLIVIGTHGRGGMERLLLGSVAEAVTHHANVPVMLVSQKQRLEQWQPSVLEALAREVTEERERKARNPQAAAHG
jgi:nucleotide-binding universal stress UspA family protein